MIAIFIYALILPLLVGAVFYLAPRWSGPNSYFAVAVVPGFCHHPEARKILARYRVSIWIYTIASGAVALAAIFSRGEFRVSAGFSFAILWLLMGGVIAFRGARRKVLLHEATSPGACEVSAVAPPLGLKDGWWLQLGPFIILGATATYLARSFAQLPGAIAVHWNLQGQADRWVTRSPLMLFGTLALGGLICLGLGLMAQTMMRAGVKADQSALAAQQESCVRRATLTITFGAEYLVALMACWIGLLPLVLTRLVH